MEWWRDALSPPWCGFRFAGSQLQSPDIVHVDASDWGIGLVVNNRWRAWKLVDSWKGEGRSIGWAEIVAVELAVGVFVRLRKRDVSILIWSDNAGVVGAFRAQCSRNPEQNASLRRTLLLTNDSNIHLRFLWVALAVNLADGPSRGVLPRSKPLLPLAPIPPALRDLVVPVNGPYDVEPGPA
jgi:hypothetical protein